MNWQQNILLFGAAALAGAVNSVAGGGTLLTFPALLGAGFPAVIANATSTVALWPGQLSSLWGYRDEIGRNRRAMVALAIPSLIGGWLGARLLIHTDPKTFERIVPFLILTATLLFTGQEPLARWQKRRQEARKLATLPEESGSTGQETPSAAANLQSESESRAHWPGIIVFQFFVAIYGGYFGAGIGILMLAALGLMGFTNIHQMNGLKNINGLCINAVAAIMFIGNGLVDWHLAGMMAIGSIIGGYSGSGIARQIGQKNVRRIVIFIGFALTLSLLFRR